VSGMAALATRRFRLVGPAAPHARGRLRSLGLTEAEDGDAFAVCLGPDDAASVASIARALPDPASLPDGALVVVLPAVHEPASLASRLRSALGRGRTIPRAHRCSALLSRGYVQIGAALEGPTRQDLAWGSCPDLERDEALTGPC
jgi:hypothetical protein